MFAPGERGGGVIIGGAWLQVDGRQVDDLHYRDLDDVEHWLAEARLGRFKVERLPFYLAGIPTYVVVRELAVAQVLVGELPRPGYARRGDALGCAGSLARAVIEAAHARLAAKGAWVLNEKRIVQRAGLDHLTAHFADLGRTPGELHHAVQVITEALASPSP